MKTTNIVAMAFIGLLSTLTLSAQNNNVGIGTTTPDASAILEMTSTTQGVLVPRMTEAERNNIKGNSNAALSATEAGLLIYQTDQTPGFYYWTGTVWIALSNVAETDPEVNMANPNYVPKWDGNALIDGTITDVGGNVGINVAVPSAMLDVAGAVKITDGTEGEAKVLTSDANGNASWQTLGTESLFGPAGGPPTGTDCIAITGSLAAGSSPSAVAVMGNYAYVTDLGTDELKVIDISSPDAPVQVGSVAITDPYHLAIEGDYAYVITASVLHVINISNPNSPTLSGSLTIGNNPRRIAVAGNYAYLTNAISGNDPFRVIDISNPGSPTYANNNLFKIGNDPKDYTVSGNYVYVVDRGTDDLKVINVSNPASPSLSGSVAITNTSAELRITVSGNYAYILFEGTNQLQIFDISNPAAPAAVTGGALTIGPNPRSIDIQGANAFVVDYTNGDLTVIDISNPALPISSGTIPIGTNPLSIDVEGDYAYVVDDGSDDLKVIALTCDQTGVIIDPVTGEITYQNLKWQENSGDLYANNSGSVAIGTSTNNPSAKLEVESTTQGFLPPRMTEAERNAIATPVAAGLIVWCTDCGSDGETQVYNGTAWTNMVGDPATPHTPVIGEAYGGGLVAYVLQPSDPGYDANVPHGIIVASADVSGTWSCYNASPSSTPTGFGEGANNTALIIAANCTTGVAQSCANYSITVGGVVYDDWYLPSKDEMFVIYGNRASLGMVNNFAYWTSSVVDALRAYTVLFLNGDPNVLVPRSESRHFRAVRSF